MSQQQTTGPQTSGRCWASIMVKVTGG